MYIISPAAGVGDSYAYTLDNYNFKRLDVAMWRFCNAPNNNIWVYEKQVQPGDVYNLGRWAVVFSSATQLDFMTGNPIVSDSELAIMESQNGHETRNMTLGSTVFTNRSQYTFYDMPYWLAGKNYIYNPYDTTEKMAKATRAGYVYMLTSTTGNISQVSNLQSQNFEMVTIPTVDLFGGSSQGGAYPDYGFSLLRKYVNVGDTVTWKQWAIPIFSGDLQLSDSMAELTPNADTSKVAKMTSGARLFNNRLYYLQEELPLALDGKSFLYDSIENGGSAKVTKAGKAYIYIPVMTSQYDLETQVKNAGWVQTPYRIFRLSAGLQYGSRLYEKEVTVGEEIHFGKYNLLIHAGMAEQDYYVLPSVSQAAEIITNPEGSKYSVVEQNWLGCPTIERSPEGRLWASWFTGGEYELGLGNFSLISYSGDDGETWKHAAFAVEHPDENVVVTKPEFWTDPNGRLWLFWVQHTGGGNFDGKMGVWASICENPDGVNPVWSTPKRLSDGYLRSKPLVLQNGEWIYSAFDWMSPHETAIYVSTDEGVTWNLRGKTECLDTSSGKNNLDDPVLVEKKDGTLWHLIRTDDGPYESFSYDHGKTWTHAVKSSISGPATRMTIDRLASGNLLMVYHDATWRTNLTAYLSTDDGETWSHKLLLDERGNVTYPDTIQSSDGTIYVIYDRERTSEKEILMATFTEDDVVAGAFNSSKARQKVLINDPSAELPLLQVNGDATLGTVAVGGTAWSDQTYTFTSMPECFIGETFVYGKLYSAVSVDILKSGYVYVLTTARGDQGSVCESLDKYDFKRLEVPQWSSLSFSYKRHTWVYEMKVEAGEHIELPAWWGTLIASETQLDLTDNGVTVSAEELAIVESTSGYTVSQTELRNVVFTDDATYKFQEIPYWLAGKSYIFGPRNGGTVEVTRAGKLYMIGNKTSARKTYFTNLGFTLVQDMDVEPWNGFSANGFALYEKDVVVGEKVTWNWWGVPIFYSDKKLPAEPPVSIEITSMPNKQTYKLGENFDPTGMVVEGTDKYGNKYELSSADYVTAPTTFSTDVYAAAVIVDDMVVAVPVTITNEKGVEITDETEYSTDKFSTQKAPVLTGAVENHATLGEVISTIKKMEADGATSFFVMLPHLNEEYRNVESYRQIVACTEYPVMAIAYGDYASTEWRLGLLKDAVKAGFKIVDIPMNTYDADSHGSLTGTIYETANPNEVSMNAEVIEKQKALIREFQNMGAEVLMSAHVGVTLTEEQGIALAKEMEARGADVAKIALGTGVNHKEVLNTNLKLKEELSIPFWYNGTGDASKPYRTASCLMGSLMVFCYAEYRDGNLTVYDYVKDLVEFYNTVPELRRTIETQFSVSTIFSNNMLLQRNKPVKVFGTGGNIGDSVKVTFAGQEKITEITSGEWSVYLDAMEASTTGRTMTIEYIPDGEDTPTKTFTYDGIVVGELWLCSGQSNMEFHIDWLKGTYPDDMAPYDNIKNLKQLRVYTVPILESKTPLVYNDCAGWIVPSADESGQMSATALGFASHLQASLGDDVPVGVIVSAKGASLIEKWLDAEAITDAGTTYSDVNSVLYNGMIHQIKGMSIAGILWYQGEANCWAPDLYEKQFAEYTKLYRKLFEDKELPIITFQLPQFELDTTWPDFRQIQWNLTTKIDNLYAVCGIDLGEAEDIHPGDKYFFTKRASDVAYKYVYATETENLPGLSPYPNAVYREKDALRVVFNDAASLSADAAINGFEGYNGSEWVALTAEISGADVLLTGDIEDITSVRYLYAVTLSDKNMIYNEHGLPVAPFKEFEVEVQKGTVKSIYVTSQPTKTEYFEGETFDPTGMVVMASYNDDRADAVITQYTLSCNELSKDTTKITISYGGKTTQVAITVKPIDTVEKISLTNDEWKWEEFKVEAIENSKYVAVTANIKALVSLDKTAWINTLVIGMGSDANNAYSFNLAFGPDNNGQPVNLVKLFQADNVYEGDTIPQEQWVNARALEQIFSDNGTNVKMIRMDRMVYLQAYMDGEWKIIGRMTLPEGVISYIHFGNYGTACEFNDVKVSIGKQAALDVFNDVTVEFDNTTQARYFPIGESNWMVEAKVFDSNPTANTEKRLMTVGNVSILYQYGAWKTQLTNLWSVTEMSGELASALSNEGLYVRYVCAGNTLRTFLSADGVHWTKGMARTGMEEDMYAGTGLTPTPGIIALHSFQAERIEDMKIYIGVEDADYSASAMMGSRVTLGDNIGIDFYMELSEETLNDRNAYMEFVLPGENHTSEKVMVQNAKAVTQDGKEAYVFSCGIAAKEMASDIKLRIVRGDGTVAEEYIYQVKDYGNTILNDTTETYTQADKDMVKAMLNYGSYAQQHFGYNTVNLANAAMEEVDRLVAMPTLDENFNYTLEGTVDGLSYYGTSLMLVTNTSIRHYFKVSEGEISDYTFTCNGQKLTPVKKGARYYVEITDIAASELDEMYSLTITKGTESMTLTYGPYTYIKTIVAGNSYNAETKNIMAALYAYSVVAENYLTNSQQ